MDVKQIKVYSTMLRNWRNGMPSDVFDLMYESSLEYAAVREVLTLLIANGDARQTDLKTYELLGDVEKRAAEIFACGDFAREKEMREKLVNVLRNVAAVKADDELQDSVRQIIEEAARVGKDGGAGVKKKKPLSEKDFLIFDEDFDEDDDDDDDDDEDDDRNNGELCAEKARPFYEHIKEDVNEDFDSVMENVFGVVGICNHCYIAPEHLMLSMLCTECTAYDVLVAAGVDSDEYYSRFRRIVPKGTIPAGLTPRAKFLLRRAISIAKDIDGAEALAGSQHLLLALLAETRTTAIQILKDTGADIERISDELDKVLKKQEG